ncbi:MAG: SH3 domain-containing protein [Acidobacteriota bacterium]
MKRSSLLLLCVVAAFRCSAPAPAPQTAPEAVSEEAPRAEPSAIGSVRVTASTLNVRRQPSTTGDVITQVRKGTRLTLVTVGNDWMQVLLANGDKGWVSSQFVERAGAPATASGKARRSGCTPDSDYGFVKTPTPTFSDSGAHGLVIVEAKVDRSGNVLTTHVVSNSTGDDALGFLTEREIKQAKFVAPVRDCSARPFIFTYTRTF